MTWVVAGKHLFCARAISDIQVTLEYPDGKKLYYDSVQKTHAIGSKIVILFAGSIRLAFSIIEKLKTELPRRLDERLYSEPDVVIKKITRYIKYYYKNLKAFEKEHVEFLILISPVRTLTEFGMWKMVSPAFGLIERKEAFEMLEIGSGSIVREYRDIVQRNSVGVYVIDNGPDRLPDVLVPVGKQALKFVFAEALEYQNAGISKAMNITLLTHDEIFIRELPEKPEGEFPHVATSWEELSKLLGKKGIKIAECHALA